MPSFKDVLSPVLGEVVTPALGALGYSPKAPRSARPYWVSGEVQISTVVDSSGVNGYRGGCFTLEFEVVDEDGKFSTKLWGRVRLDQLLDDRQKSRLLKIRNAVAGTLNPLPQSVIDDTAEKTRTYLLRPYVHASELESDLFMRVLTKEHAYWWCEAIAPDLEIFLARFGSLDLGRFILNEKYSW